MKDDIVRRLLDTGEGDAYLAPTSTKLLMDEAADEIERLRTENARLREALEKIAQHDMQAVAMDALRPGERIRPTEKKFRDALVEISTLAGDPSAYWTARAALAEQEKK